MDPLAHGRLTDLEAKFSRLAGEDERNGRVGRVEAEVRRLKWPFRIAIFLASLCLGGVVGGVLTVHDRMQQRARDEGAEAERWRLFERRIEFLEGVILGAGISRSSP